MYTLNASVKDENSLSNGLVVESCYVSLPFSLSSEVIVLDGRSQIQNMEGLQGETFVLQGDVLIENVSNSILVIEGSITSVKIKNMVNSHVTVTSSGPVHVNDCSKCLFTLGCDQLRIHSSRHSRFEIATKAGCIIEDCTDVEFGPLDETTSTDQWKCVQDFSFASSFTYV